MTSPSEAPPPFVLDLSGLFCPVVVLEIARAVRENPHIEWFEIVSTDPLSAIDVPVYAARNGLLFTACGADPAGGLRFRIARPPAGKAPESAG